MSETLTLRAVFAATPSTVYAALTDADAVRTWLAEHAEISLTENEFEFWGRYTPQGEPDRQRLLAAEPDRLLRFSWTLDGEPTTTEFRLRPDGTGGTTLDLTQTGVPTLEEMLARTGPRDGLHTLHTFWGLAVANLAAYVEDRALVPRCEFGADRPDEIRIELPIAAAAAEVFDSLVDPDAIERWFGWRAEVEPRVGGRITLGADGKIFEFEPGRVLAYADGEMVTRWELAESGGKTYLTFVQSGFGADELDNAAQHEAGWLGGLAELRRLHELGADYYPLTVEPESAESTVFTHETRLAAAPSTVYAAFTDPGALRTWLAEHVEISLADNRFEFWGRYTPDGEPGRQRLLAAEPDRLLRFEWTLDGTPTTVEIQLRPDGPDGSILALSQTDWVPFDAMLAGKSSSVRGVVHTFWALSIANLADYLAGRTPTPMCDYAGSGEFRAELDIDAPVERVYASVAEPERFESWFGARPGDIVLAGHAGAVSEPEPGRTITFSWGTYGFLRWELAGSEGRTHLTVVQSGFDGPPIDVSGWAGWLSGIAELRRLHELTEA